MRDGDVGKAVQRSSAANAPVFSCRSHAYASGAISKRKQRAVVSESHVSPRHIPHSRPKDGVASLAYGARHVGSHAGVFHRPLCHWR